jgi:hypothetical protein
MSPRRVVLGRALFSAAAALVAPCASDAQEPVLLPVEPPTRLEAFMVRQGALMVQGSSRVGGVRAALGSLITVGSRELTDVQSGEHALGVAIEVRSSRSRDPDRVSYVDLDELPPLLAALDYMSRVQRSETALDRFEARYVTKGGLLVSVFDVGDGMRATVASGVLANAAATELEFGEFQRLRQLLHLAYEGLSALNGR